MQLGRSLASYSPPINMSPTLDDICALIAKATTSAEIVKEREELSLSSSSCGELIHPARNAQ